MTAIESKELEKVNERLNGVEQDLSELKSGVKEIKDAILGNEFNPNASIKARLEKLETFAEGLKGHVMMAKAWGVVLGAVAVFLLELIKSWSSIVDLVHKK